MLGARGATLMGTVRRRNMAASQKVRASGVLAFLPLVLGNIGLLLCSVYEAQRSALLFHSLSRFLQHHLDGLAGGATLAGLTGIVVGFSIRHFRGGGPIILFGIGLSLAALVWSLIFLPL